MIDINWNIFKAKFNGRENGAFELLAYMLFCYEHQIKVGIFRFKNQTGIETEPIDSKGKIIGFQAKYYDTKLAENKNDIIDSLKKAKEKNPALNKILIYTNHELSESSNKRKKNPSYLIEIETVAKSIGIEIEWRVPSHIEKQISIPENNYLSQYFFATSNGIVEFLKNFKLHTENILFAIQTDIQFDGQHIKVNRENTISNLENSEKNIILLAGDGGTGKTAVIKDLFHITKSPLYVLKAAEFNRNSLAALFNEFGPYGLIDFLQAHKEESRKIFVIDSAEKLADLENQDVFIEFLSALIKNHWKIIFTTRNSYLDDLRFQMLAVYRLSFETLRINVLGTEELKDLAERFHFSLPKDEKLCTLLSNLFYLNEYLSNYDAVNDHTDLKKFREVLWQKTIQHSKVKKNNIHLDRENCFLRLAKSRCETGNFYQKADYCSQNVLALLVIDEVIKFEPSQGGYFITHDIYEEWALEKLIDREYAVLSSNAEFFKRIGNSLPIRRAFRSWLSAKLFQNDQAIKNFIERGFQDSFVPAFWKDELLISILLSDYSADFIKTFAGVLLDNKKFFLKKVIFLLRIACKEADDEMQAILNVREEFTVSLGYVFTKPKGKGWEAVIKFLFEIKDIIKKEELKIVLPLLKEWIDKSSKGETTRITGLIALHFYKAAELSESYYKGEIEKDLLKIILSAARELKSELTEIVNFLVEKKRAGRAFDSFQEIVLTSNNDSLHFIFSMPAHVIKLAEKAWYQPKETRHPYDFGGVGVDGYYSISSHWHHEYYPASAFQTPIYYLLQVAAPQTIKYIVSFTNRAVQDYVSSDFEDDVDEVEFSIGSEKFKQFISPGLWCMYRGTGSPVTPYLLQSMHMALEKFFLEITKTSDKKVIHDWLIYLLKNTRSASITAVVASIVLAYPEELFDVAIILFSEYEFLMHDMLRESSETHAQQLYSVGAGFDYQHKQFEEERQATCKQPHRKMSLENLALQYQYFKSEETSDEEVKRRQNVIWRIIDRFHANLPSEETEPEKNRHIRLLLERMDRRKMNPTIKGDPKRLIIELNPALDPDLKEYSERAIRRIEDETKYTGLKLWGTNKWEGHDRYGSYPRYDESPELVMKETKEIINLLQKGNERFNIGHSHVPGYACSALVRLYSDKLYKDDLTFCNGVITSYAAAPLRENYGYQIADGVEVSVNALPALYKQFPENIPTYNFILLFLLFDERSIGQYKRICDYSIETIQALFAIDAENANKILLTYLILKVKFDEEYQPRNPRNYNKPRSELLEEFATKYEAEIEQVEPTRGYYEKIDFNKLSLRIVDTIFQLIPDDSNDSIHLDFVKKMISAFGIRMLSEEKIKDDFGQTDYYIRRRFFKKLARFLLNRDTGTTREWAISIATAFANSDGTADLISDIVSAEDQLNKYENFWIIWESFYPTIKFILTNSEGRDVIEIANNYLFAWPYWKETAKEWHSLQEREKLFFKKVCEEIGFHPAVLYSIAKLLNQVGSSFLEDGIIWISEMLSENKSLHKEELRRNTIFYLEVLARKYVYLNRIKLKMNIFIKGKVLVLLDFLVNKGSVNGYLLREDII